MTAQSGDHAALREALKLVSRDMHNTSGRPCSTCSTVTKVLGEPFGCDAYRLELQQRQIASPGAAP